MVCPKCGSESVSVQMVTDTQLKSGHGIIWWLLIGWWWVPVKWICFFWIALIVKIFGGKHYRLKTTHYSQCVCQNCGYHWTPDAGAPDPLRRATAAASVAPPKGAVRLVRTQTTDPEVKTISDYVVLDTETTGLNPEIDKVVDIALLKISGGKIVDEYCTLVNPQQHINIKSSKIHGIFDKDVMEAPIYDDVGEEVVKFLGNCTIVGHNVKFDLGFMGGLLKNVVLQDDLTWNFIDTIPLAKAAYPGMENYKLQTLVEQLGIESEGAHRARADALTTWRLFELCQGRI